MVKSFQDLHDLVRSEIERYLAENPEASISFSIADNGSCTMLNELNKNKFVFMFARFGKEYKVGFAFYEGAGFNRDPVWIDDIEDSGFDENFMRTLITEHLILDTQTF